MRAFDSQNTHHNPREHYNTLDKRPFIKGRMGLLRKEKERKKEKKRKKSHQGGRFRKNLTHEKVATDILGNSHIILMS